MDLCLLNRLRQVSDNAMLHPVNMTISWLILPLLYDHGWPGHLVIFP